MTFDLTALTVFVALLVVLAFVVAGIGIYLAIDAWQQWREDAAVRRFADDLDAIQTPAGCQLLWHAIDIERREDER